MTERIITDSNGRKHITTEPLLYLSQRPWVGLTEDEAQELHDQWQDDGWGSLFKAIEAKLKEKNT